MERKLEWVVQRMVVKVLFGVVASLVLAVPGWSQGGADSVGSDFDARLERLAAEIEQSRVALHAPGVALAIVRGDEVVFARGFGLADIENQTPVTPETRFFIGSTTKAFTATLIGMLVDDGLMGWDDPVTDHLPYFTLAVDSEDPEAQATVRDILSHRTGFPRMGLLWANGTLSSEEILRQAAMAEPFAPHRARFYYNNVQYLAAGWAAAAAAGDEWGSLIEERILGPLGMEDTRTLTRGAREDPLTAKGYTWDELGQDFKPDPSAPDSPGVDPVAPAGSIGSSVLDMARWVRFLLDGGVVNGEALVSPESLQETWTTQIGIGPGIGYGMGWMIRDWQGQRLIAHDGGVPGGYSATVGLLPDSDVGFVFLSNALQPLLPALVVSRVPEILLGDLPDTPTGTTEAEEFGPYLGRYIANFATFSNEVFTVLEQEGNLALDIPSQMVFALNPPDTDGRWQFSLTDQIAITFNRDDAGDVVGLTVHQAGMAFEVPREGVEIAPEIDLAELDRYLGSYTSEEGLELRILVQNQRLALGLPNAAILDLRPPDAGGRWVSRANAELGVSFEESETGQVTGLDFFRPAGQPVIHLARSGAAPAALPTLDEIMELRGIASAGSGSATSRSRGRIRFPQSAVEGEFETLVAGEDRLRIDIDLGRFGQTRAALNGDRAWTDSSSDLEPFTELAGDRLEQMLLEHPAVTFGDWRRHYDEVQVVREDAIDDRRVFLVRLASEGLPPRTLAVDAETGDVLRDQRTLILPGDLGRLPVVSLYEDYREVDGTRVPFRTVESNEAMGRTIYEVLSLETDVELDPESFVLEPVE